MRRRHRTGFTLIEALVAIGAIAIIGVGLASVFESVGETVTRGRRVRELNEIAKRVEEQLRSDISKMTRDGPLVIRNQVAVPTADPRTDNGEKVYLSAEDPNPRPSPDDPRPRRVDELMFFARGEFASARQPIRPGFRATADAARIVYEQGMKLVPDTSSPLGATYEHPELSDAYRDNPNVAERLGWGTRTRTLLGKCGPNELAAGWTLLRHVTLLARPRAAEPFDPGDQIPGVPWVRHLDSRYQIAGQPASPTVFQALTQYPPYDYEIRSSQGNLTLDNLSALQRSTLREDLLRPTITGAGINNVFPVFSSGLLDIATTSLDEIRRVVLGASTPPGLAWRNASGSSNLEDFMTYYVNPSYAPVKTALFADNGPLDLMQRWMIDAFPDNQHGLSTSADPVPASVPAEAAFLQEATRLRYEPTPPDDVGVLQDTSLSPLDQEIALGDQQMLSASVFVPRCSEFIVEWSFGDTIPYVPANAQSGQLMWHGLWRIGDADGDGQFNGNGQEFVTLPYPMYWNQSSPRWLRHQVTYEKPDGTTGTRTIDERLIHPEARINNPTLPPMRPMDRALFTAGGRQLTSCFGYIDPTFVPGTGDPQTVEWAWPKLIRITMSLADPDDPTLERTFQFVFEVPDDRVN